MVGEHLGDTCGGTCGPLEGTLAGEAILGHFGAFTGEFGKHLQGHLTIHLISLVST